MKKILIIGLILLVAGSTTDVYSQSWGEKLGKKALERVKQKTEDKVEKTVDKTMDKVFDGAENAVKGEGGNNQNQGTQQQGTVQQGNNTQIADVATGQQQSDEVAWNKSDFVAGDEIIFEDNLVGEQLGEFPAQWDLKEGNAEIAKVNSENNISMEQWTKIAPLMKDMKNYLSESFTIEFDFYVPTEDNGDRFFFHLVGGDDKDVATIDWVYAPRGADEKRYTAQWLTTSGSKNQNTVAIDMSRTGWHKFALSFNKRALKVYIDGIRITNVPNVAQASSVIFEKAYGEQNGYIKNIRIAKGAVPLYDRMMSDGKFITYGITFDVGKSTIKPESMGEINRVVELMTQNPDLKFSVEGHTDATGNAASNQTLSEARSKAIADKLVSLGISSDRLVSSGKGQNNPIADNGTDEGRAKNRRVEFVKM